jgi:general secretion pathway protein D
LLIIVNFLKILQFLKKRVKILFLLFLSSCTTTQSPPPSLELPKPLRTPTHIKEEPTPATPPIVDTRKRETQFLETPDYPPLQTVITDDSSVQATPILKGEPVSINVENIPLPAFINEIFGNLLKLSFQISPELQSATDLVTLRITDPQTPEQLYELAKQVLDTYGISILQQDKLLHFVPTNKAAGGGPPPLLISGRTLPDVPASHRPIFQFVPLKVINANEARGWMLHIYQQQGLKIESDPMSNSLLLFGKANDVQQVLNAIALFDQPYMRSRYSVRIEPTFISAQDLASGLTDILKSQGYSVSSRPDVPNSSVVILPIISVNALIVFASDLRALEQVKKWAVSLDKQGFRAAGDSAGLFFYPVQNTHAKELVDILNPLLTGIINSEVGKDQPVQAVSGNSKGNFVVDEVRNAIIFQGNSSTWAQLLPIMQKIDQPSKLVLIEVIVAEVTLTDREQLGFEFLIKGLGINHLGGTFGTLSSNAGLYMLDSAGQTRAILKAFSENSRVNILSSPRVMVKSGESASISVGTEVPIITTQGASNQQQEGGNSVILQQIQYRRTGTILDIKPSVYAGNRVDITLNQEVSRALPISESSGISSPAILNRSIKTVLSLEDGGSVLLGGLIDIDQSDGHNGVPVLKDIPLLGGLFRSKNQSNTRTELLMMIVPYVIDNQNEAEKITEAFRQQIHIIEEVPTNLETGK